MIIYPQKPWQDGQTFKHTASDGTELIGTYNAEKNVWTFYRTNEDGTGVGGLVTTADVVTLNDRPTRLGNPFSLTDDPSTVINQQEANWWLMEDIQSILYVTDTAPSDDGHQNRFWYDTNTLELFVWYEGAWFPTSVTSGGISEETFTYSINRIKGDAMTVIPNPPQIGDEFTNDATGVTYKYDGEKWVVIGTPTDQDLSELSADVAVLTQRVADGETVQGQIQGTINDALDTQSEIQEDVSTLEAKIDALEATVLDGKWQMDVRSVAGAGKFVVLGLGGNATEWADVIKLQMNPISYDGKSYTFAEVSVEDVVRIGYPGSSASFKVTSPFVQSGDVYEATVELLVSESQPFGSVIYAFEFLPSFDPSAYATVDYVDKQDEKTVKKAGTNTVDDNFKIKTASKTFVSVGEDLNLYHVADPTGGNDGWAANKGYVDSSIASIPPVSFDGYATEQYVDNAINNVPSDYLPLSGGELTGNLTLNVNSGLYTSAIIKSTRDTGYALQIKPDDTGDATAYIHTNGNAEFSRVKVRDTPTNNSDLTTKEYVDNAVAGVSAPPTGPATLAWEWRNHDTLSDPGEGKVAWYSNSSFFRLNLRTANGVFLGKNVLAKKDISFNQHLTGGIWRLVSGDWQMVQLFQINRMQWNHNDCVWLYRNNIILGGNNFTAGQNYYFTVGGFF